MFKAISLGRRLYLLLLLGIVAIDRLFIIQWGALVFPDEDRYVAILRGASSLVSGDLKEAIIRFFVQTDGRPAMALFYLPAALISNYLEAKFGISALDFPVLYLPLVTNVLISVCLSISVFGVGRSWFGLPVRFAIAAALIHASFTNVSLQTTAFFPVQASLLILFSALILASNGKLSSLRIFTIGIFLCLGVLTYPGNYILFSAIVFSILYVALKSFGAKGLPRRVLIMALGGVVPLLVCEILSRVVGASFFDLLAELSGSVTLGDYSETLIFVPRYLWEVEGIPGVGALIFCGLYWVRRCFFSYKEQRDTGFWLVSLSLFFALIHGLLGVWATHVVFYGRLVSQLLPLLILATICFWHDMKISRIAKLLLMVAIIALCGIHHLNSTILLFSSANPLQFAKTVRGQLDDVSSICEFQEYSKCGSYFNTRRSSPMPVDHECNSSKHSLIFVNLCDFFPLAERRAAYTPSSNESIIASKPHYLVHPYFLYEGLTEIERVRAREWGINVRAYLRE